MWLSGLHIPESYLTALVQATCRRNGWPLDRSTLFTQVTKFQDADEVNERAGQGTVSSLSGLPPRAVPHSEEQAWCGRKWARLGLKGRLLRILAVCVHGLCLDLSGGRYVRFSSSSNTETWG